VAFARLQEHYGKRKLMLDSAVTKGTVGERTGTSMLSNGCLVML
jgi:hypothetical protein